MNQIDANVITALLKAFIDVFTQGTANLIPIARWILFSLGVIETATMGLWIAMGSGRNIAGDLLTLAMKTTLYLFLITSWSTLTRALVRGFITFGLLGAGGEISETDFTDPALIAWIGIGQGIRVLNRLNQYTGLDGIYNIVDVLCSLVAVFFCFLGFVRYALEVFVALLEFYGTSAVSVVLIPFGMVRYSSFVTEKALAHLWAGAIKLLMLAFMTGTSLVIMRRIPGLQSGLNPDLGTAITFALAGCTIAFLAVRFSRIVNGYLHGTPQLSSQDVSHSVRSTTQVLTQMAHSLHSAARRSSHASRAAQRRP